VKTDAEVLAYTERLRRCWFTPEQTKTMLTTAAELPYEQRASFFSRVCLFCSKYFDLSEDTPTDDLLQNAIRVALAPPMRLH
jgi:hypothetical protein